jgi:acetate kinase
MGTDEMQDCLLTINGGSSSIKFAVYRAAREPARLMGGEVERIGGEDATLVASAVGEKPERRPVGAGGHDDAARAIIDWVQGRLGTAKVVGIGHRIVHGGARLVEHQPVTPELIAELRRTEELDRVHLPGEIALIETMGEAFGGVSQVACFDTAFHREMPRVAKLLPIPRQYEAAGVRRFGFHGLSYTYLMKELRRTAGATAAEGRVILAHLGNGASMAAVRGGRPIETTMAFTPTAGLMMGTRPGDLDPGLLAYLVRVENLNAEGMEEFINKRCGLIGVSETSSDMRDLIARRGTDIRAAEAVELFCYSARKWIGSLAAVMGGLETIVFSGGIGEHSAEVRAEICAGLEFLGVRIDPSRNAAGAAIISTADARVDVRVIKTDEEIVIARTVCGMLGMMGS